MPLVPQPRLLARVTATTTATATATATTPLVRRAALSTSAKRSLDHVYPRTVHPPPTLQIGPTVRNRLEESYETTLARDLMYMTFNEGKTPAQAREEQRAWIAQLMRKLPSDNPYSKNHSWPGLRGVDELPPRETVLDPTDLVNTLPRIEKVYLHTVVESAI